MRLEREKSCDVLVAGGGIAGLIAALKAARDGASVLLAAAGGPFSGSSFYPGTWGLGLVGPESGEDEQDLARTIREVGCGMADPEMVDTFVRGITPAIDELRRMGVPLRRAKRAGEKEFIPCFDHKNRDWNGIESAGFREILERELGIWGVGILPRCELAWLVQPGGPGCRICGAVIYQDGQLHYLGCRTLVLATGGYGTLFSRHLCTEDVKGTGQALALEAGASLVNMEFMQMMPGYLSPAYQTIFNEKTFRYAQLTRADETALFPEGPQSERLLAIRSAHGPFTCRLDSGEVDRRLFQACLEDERGVKVTYSPRLRQDTPEFITTYFEWLKQEKGLTMDDPVQIGIFAHAANGGIRIDSDAFTGVPGLFACGEVTGGMHGADRIGGLSTANGLVFGGIAGHCAASASFGVPEPPETLSFDGWEIPDEERRTEQLQEAMSRTAMVLREEQGLRDSLALAEELADPSVRRPSDHPSAIVRGRRLAGRLTTARCVLTAALARRESRGAHFRMDYPVSDPSLAHPLRIRQENGREILF